MNLFEFMGTVTKGYTPPRTIRNIRTGRAVDNRTLHDLHALPERVLRDIGYTSR